MVGLYENMTPFELSQAASALLKQNGLGIFGQKDSNANESFRQRNFENSMSTGAYSSQSGRHK